MGLTLALSACGSSSTDTASGGGSSSSAAAPTTTEASTSDSTAVPEPFGAGCAGIPADGAGSSAGMAMDPVATAASNNMDLSTLVTAVTAAGLVDTLNTTDNLTVFAPSNEAFAAVDPAALASLLEPANVAQLSAILTYHVIGERIAPEDLAGTFTTLNGAELTVDGSGEMFTTNVGGTPEASVVCGNVQTANATVYIIDQVMMPAAA
ncbi:MAG: fasciclin domain-containing protein [Geodermatophilaceae bacterium]|nr:fasciclin domain-containing protein [Geodermatophilaceae bacterium]